MKPEQFLKSMSWKHDVQYNGIGGVDVVSAGKARDYAKLKVIEELEDWYNYMENDCGAYRNQDLLKEFENRIKELKQD